MKTRTHLRSVLTLLALLLALPLRAQPLIDQVPDSAALYVGWRGAEDMGPDYQGSNLQGVLEQTGLLQALPQLVDVLQDLGQDEEMDPEVGRLMSMGGTLWGSMWSNGGAMYMLPPEENGPPIPRLAILWNKGADEAEVRATLSNIVEMMNDAEQVPAFMGNAGDAVFLSIGFDASDAAADSLGNTDRFKQAAAQVQGDGALVVYVDVKQWIGQVDQFAEQMKQQAEEWGESDPFAELWPTVRDVSGLSGVNRLMLSAGIKDKDWHTRLYLDAPAPRTGILSLIDSEPITPDNLRHVPKTATYLQVFTLDPARVLDVTRDILGSIDPGMVESLDNGLKAGGDEVGVDLERELINGFGPVWSVYIDPMVAGNGFSSLVMVNELRNPRQVEQALMKLTEAANNAIADGLDETPIKVRLLTQEFKGAKITHLGIPYVAPSWMVNDGKLYVSLFPQGLEMAVEHSGEVADSILANAAFNATMQRLEGMAGGDMTGLTFTDLPETAADGYGINLMIVQTIAGLGEMFGGEPSSLRMPPIGKVMPFITPAGSITTVGEDGLHLLSIEPFPGSALLGPAKGMESMMAVSGPLAVGVMLPALGSARVQAREIQAMTNAKEIVFSCHAYAADHDGQSPGDIAQLTDYVWGPDLWIAPNSQRAEQTPFNFDDWDEARQQAFIRENSSYVLVPLGPINEIEQPSDTILLFQRPDDAPGLTTFAVGYADGHTEVEHDLESLAATLKEQTGKTIDELIQRQEQFGN